jgi:hypothetical protein
MMILDIKEQLKKNIKCSYTEIDQHENIPQGSLISILSYYRLTTNCDCGFSATKN